MMHIVLHEPEIPQNTGNIARTCAATGAALHLIEPLGFSLDEKHIKRAGLDYWHLVEVHRYANYQEFLEKNHFPKVYMATTKSRQTYVDVQYEEDCYIMFGRESAGIPEEILLESKETCIPTPLLGEPRSLPWSNSAAIVLYEPLTQPQFAHLLKQGELHRYHW